MNLGAWARIAFPRRLGYANSNVGPTGPVGESWNGLHQVLKKSALTAKSTPTQARSCSKPLLRTSPHAPAQVESCEEFRRVLDPDSHGGLWFASALSFIDLRPLCA